MSIFCRSITQIVEILLFLIFLMHISSPDIEKKQDM